MSVDRQATLLWEAWPQLCSFEALSLFLFVFFKIRDQLLGQIILIGQLDKAISNAADWK